DAAVPRNHVATSDPDHVARCPVDVNPDRVARPGATAARTDEVAGDDVAARFRPADLDSDDVAGDHVAGVSRGPADGVAWAGADILDIKAWGVVDPDSDLLARCRSVLNDGTLARGVGADQVALHRVGRREAAEDVDTGRGVARDEVALAGHVAAASVPEPSSLTLCGVAALISLGVALRRRSGVRSAGKLLSDRSRL